MTDTTPPTGPLQRPDRPEGTDGYLRLSETVTMPATLAADGHVWAQLRGHHEWVQMSRPLATGRFIPLEPV